MNSCCLFLQQTFHNQGLCSCWQWVDYLGVDKRHSRTNNKEFLQYESDWDTSSLSHTVHATPHTWHNILLAEEISHCPRDIVADRAGVQPLVAYSIMMRRLVTFSHDTMKLFRIVRSSKWENILSCKELNPWTLANLLSQQNFGKNRIIMTNCMKSAE
jgi:hypothetical protein